MYDLNNIFELCKNENIVVSKANLKSHLSRLTEGGVKLCNDELLFRLEQIILLGRNSSSLNAYILRYGKELGTLKHREKTKKTTVTRDDYIRLYGEELGLEKLKRRSASLENYILVHGPIEGPIRWEQYKIKRNKTYQDRKAEGRDYNSFSINTFIKKYGEEEGTLRWNKSRDKRLYSQSKQYLIDTYGEIKGNEIARKRWDNNSLQSFIDREGEEIGTKKYNEFCLKTKLMHNLDNLIELFGEEEGRIRYARITWQVGRSSKISNELFETIMQQQKMDFQEDDVYYGNKEYCIFLNKDERIIMEQKMIFPDFLVKSKKKIIEFFGDVWHGNPEIYSMEDCPHPFRKGVSVKELHEQDEKRINIMKSKNYDIMIVWEKEYKENKKLTIEKCLNFLQEET